MTQRIGHGPHDTGLGFKWPIQPFQWLFYKHRPDLHRSKTRPPEWLLLKSKWRHFQALFFYLGPPAHILWNIRWPWLFIMSITVGAVAWQAEVVDANLAFDIDPLGIFKDCFRLTSFVMALLLTFRLNRTYDRWNLARSSIAGVGNGATSICLMAAAWCRDNPQLLDEFRRWSIVWPYAIKMTVESAKVLDPVAEALLFPEERKVFYCSRKGRQVVVTKVRALTARANFDAGQFQMMETAIMSTWRSAGDALRIKFQAMPQAASLCCTGFVMVWLCLLPASLTSDKVNIDVRTILAMAVISLLLLGVDEVATQLEDPFGLMPLDDIVCTYERDINRITKELKDVEEASRAAYQRLDQESAEAQAQAQKKLLGAQSSYASTDQLLGTQTTSSVTAPTAKVTPSAQPSTASLT